MMNKSLKDLSIQFVTPQECLFASYASDGSIEVLRANVDEFTGLKVRQWREKLNQSVNLKTVFRFLPLFSTEQTKLIPLVPEVLALSDQELVSWLVDAEKTDMADMSGYPVFDSPMMKDGQINSVYDFARLKTGEITLTELPYPILSATLTQVFGLNLLDRAKIAEFANLPDDVSPGLLHHVETRMRAVIRHTLLTDGGAEGGAQKGAAGKSTVFLAIDSNGASFAIWTQGKGITFEVGEIFHFDEIPIDDESRGGQSVEQFRETMFLDHLERFLYEQLDNYLIAEAAKGLVCDTIRYALGEHVTREVATAVANFAAEKEQIKARPCDERYSLEEIMVRGLVMGADESALEIVPGINLGWDLKNRAEQARDENQNQIAEVFQQKKQKTLLAAAAPAVIAAALVFGWYINTWQKSVALGIRENAAQAEAARLQPIMVQRKSYETTLAWYQDLLQQMIGLRTKQTLAYGFASRLNYMYPAADQSFYLANLNIKAGGAFEISGLTRVEESVATFVKTLESTTDETGKKLFNGIAVEFKQGTDVLAGKPSVLPGSTAANTQGELKAGVSAFSIKGIYAPMTVFKMPSAAAAPTAAVPLPAGAIPPPPAAAAPSAAVPVNPNASVPGVAPVPVNPNAPSVNPNATKPEVK